jgi:drug/metabolite transporter (DMT)-like permease
MLVLISALLFSIAAPVTKYVNFGPLNVSFYRSLTGIVFLVVAALLAGPKNLRGFTFQDLLGGLAYAATSIFFFLGLHYTTAANATVLFQTAPVFLVPLGYFFLREKADRRDLTAITLMIFGIVLCFREGISTEGSRGDIFALSGALAISFLNIIMRKNRGMASYRLLITGNAIIVLICLPLQFGSTVVSVRDVALSSTLGIFHMAVPFLIYGRALKSLRALEASIFKNFESVLAPLWVALLVGELPGTWTVAGFLCVTAALIIRGVNFSKTRNLLTGVIL